MSPRPTYSPRLKPWQRYPRPTCPNGCRTFPARWRAGPYCRSGRANRNQAAEPPVKVGLIIVVALVIGALAAHLVLADNGYVLINYRGYVVETSVPILVLALVLAYIGIRLVVHIWRAPRRLGEAWARARINYAGRQATKGYIALAEGRLARGERLLTRGARRSETPLLNYLAAARAAQMQGDRARRDNWLAMACEQEPAARDAVLLTQAELQLEDGQWPEALVSLNRVRERHPTHPQALKLLGDLHFRRKAWQPLAELLPLIRRRANVPGEMLDLWSIDTYSNIMQVVRLDRVALDKVWDDVPRHLRRNPRLVLTRAQALVACGTIEDAEAEIRRTLNEDWTEALIRIYGELPTADPAAHLKRIEAWLRERPNDPELLLAAGRASIRHQLWGKARSYLEASLAIRPVPETYRVLGQLMARVGESQSASRAYERGLAMSTDASSSTTGALPAIAASAASPNPPKSAASTSLTTGAPAVGALPGVNSPDQHS
ncbi:MAG: heme biosynthesis HemY N-terminal domain-containing protein [Gammaproteobacteria bacterium]